MNVLLLVLTTVHINVIIQLVAMCVIVVLAMYLALMDSLVLVRYVYKCVCVLLVCDIF